MLNTITIGLKAEQNKKVKFLPKIWVTGSKPKKVLVFFNIPLLENRPGIMHVKFEDSIFNIC